jgi:TIR domain
LVTSDDSQGQVDFFISYNHADEGWAEWVAWVLEEEGYRTLVQAWDFRPGSNFVVEMNEAAQRATQTIAILSPNYLRSQFAEAEWAAAFAEDPIGRDRVLIPVRIAPTAAGGLMSQIVRIDLVGFDRSAAKTRLLAGLRPGRAKPITEPPFPGSTATVGSSTTNQKPQETTLPLIWQRLTEQPAVSWRSDFLGSYGQHLTTMVELHMIPIPPLYLEVRRLRRTDEELAEIGRSAGLFSATQALNGEVNARYGCVMSQPGRQQDEIGLAVTRTGQRSVWLALPHDSMGAVFDRDDLRPRLAALIKLLRYIALPEAECITFALRLEPLSLLSIGSASTVGHRSSTTMPFASRNSCTIEPEDSITLQALDANVDDVADELTERLAAALGSH